MPGQSETKLFKLVCKRATSMRERYRSSHWTTNQIKKENIKKTSVNKTKQKSESIGEIKKYVRQSSSSIEKVCIIEGYTSLYLQHLLTDYYCSISFK
jgi:hypothetical protein